MIHARLVTHSPPFESETKTHNSETATFLVWMPLRSVRLGLVNEGYTPDSGVHEGVHLHGSGGVFSQHLRADIIDRICIVQLLLRAPEAHPTQEHLRSNSWGTLYALYRSYHQNKRCA